MKSSLTKIISAACPLTTQRLTGVNAINNLGQIVGSGTHNGQA